MRYAVHHRRSRITARRLAAVAAAAAAAAAGSAEPLRVDMVKKELALARAALESGWLDMALSALTMLRSTDFVDAELAAAHLGVLRHTRSEPGDLVEAASALVRLEPHSDSPRSHR